MLDFCCGGGAPGGKQRFRKKTNSFILGVFIDFFSPSVLDFCSRELLKGGILGEKNLYAHLGSKEHLMLSASLLHRQEKASL